MNEASGPTFDTALGTTIQEYLMGDMTSIVYPVGGGLEDWAYAAGWDNQVDASIKKCTPKTYPLPDDFFDDSLNHVATTIFLIEMADSKDPPEATYGAREVETDSYERTDLQSILSNDQKFNGHINRNIRAILALVDSAKPYVEIVGVKETSDNKVEVTFQVNGCSEINALKVVQNNQPQSFTSSPPMQPLGYCNWSPSQPQTSFKVTLENDDFSISLEVD